MAQIQRYTDVRGEIISPPLPILFKLEGRAKKNEPPLDCNKGVVLFFTNPVRDIFGVPYTLSTTSFERNTLNALNVQISVENT